MSPRRASSGGSGVDRARPVRFTFDGRRMSGLAGDTLASALDFSLAAFPLHAGRATAHHDILAAIQRIGENRFDLYVFRSFARSFWKSLCRGAEDVGYEVE